MPYTEFYITKGSAAANSNGGGPRLGTNDGPVYTTADSSVIAGALTTIVDNTGSNWSGVQVDDFVAFNPSGTTYELRRVTAVAPGGDAAKITVHANCTAAANRPTKVGGAWATVNQAATLVASTSVNAAGQAPRVNVKSGTYAETVTCQNSGTSSVMIRFEGYGLTPGDGGTPPVIASGTSGMELNCNNKQYLHFKNISITHNNASGSAAYFTNSYGIHEDLTVTNLNGTNVVWTNASYMTFRRCTFDQQTGSASYDLWYGGGMINFIGCIFKKTLNNARNVNSNGGTINFIGCAIYRGSEGIANGSGVGIVVGCIIHSCTTGVSGAAATCINTLAVGCTTGFNQLRAIDCTTYNCTTPFGSGVAQRLGNSPAVSADPCTDSANGNFTLNATAGAGAACRSAGGPGLFLDGINSSYLDIGLQHADPVGAGGGGGGSRIIGSPIILKGNK